MIKWLYRLLNHDKIEELNKTIDIYRDRNKQLESEVREYKRYKLKFEVTKLYVDDDEGLLELFEIAEKNQRYDAGSRLRASQYNGLAQQQIFGASGLGAAAAGIAGGLGGTR